VSGISNGVIVGTCGTNAVNHAFIAYLVPEPSVLSLAAGGGVALVVARLRNRRMTPTTPALA
jgi:hypothetical protein